MKKYFTAVLLISLVCSLPAFAQFKMPLKNTINQLRLVRAVERVKQGVYLPGGQVRPVPPGLVEGNRIPLTAATVSVGLGAEHPMLNHLASYRKEKLKQLSPYVSFSNKLNEETVNRWVKNGQAFYKTQAALARDVDTFFDGNGAMRIAPDGHTVKIYPLPVDGILYRRCTCCRWSVEVRRPARVHHAGL